MMGRLTGDQSQLFYEFHFDDAVPADHLVREIDAVLDLSWVHGELTPYYPAIGRPSINPELMIWILIVGHVFAIRSERALCREVKVNLANRWFLQARHRGPLGVLARPQRTLPRHDFSRVFERVAGACIAAGLVGGECFAVDASLIVADANKQWSIPGKDWDKKRDPRRQAGP